MGKKNEFDRFYECEECGGIHKLERVDHGPLMMDEKNMEIINKLIEVLSPLYEGPGIPLTIMPNLLLALSGYQYPEEYEIDEEE